MQAVEEIALGAEEDDSLQCEDRSQQVVNTLVRV